MNEPSPPTLTTTVFSQCRLGRFEAGPRRRASEGRFLHRFNSFSYRADNSCHTAGIAVAHTTGLKITGYWKRKGVPHELPDIIVDNYRDEDAH
tara:strand:- start:1905 stop:2183 length:279 start_codon:yes stop_codon:yes gene_type:complete